MYAILSAGISLCESFVIEIKYLVYTKGLSRVHLTSLWTVAQRN